MDTAWRSSHKSHNEELLASPWAIREHRSQLGSLRKEAEAQLGWATTSEFLLTTLPYIPRNGHSKT